MKSSLLISILMISQLLISCSSSPSLTKEQKKVFDTSCKDAGVKFYKKPELPVHSILFDWPSRVKRDMKSYYLFDDTFRMIQYGGNESFTRRYLDFIEERHHYPGNRHTTGHYGMGTSEAKFVRHPKDAQWFGVDESESDILVFHDVSSPEELDKPVRQQGLLRYTITVTDRRNGDKLAEMIYWVDMVNLRGCGLNLDNSINEDIFLLQATGLPTDEALQWEHRYDHKK